MSARTENTLPTPQAARLRPGRPAGAVLAWLSRLLDRLYFGASLHRWRVPPRTSSPPPPRWERLRARQGASWRQVAAVTALWLAALVVVVRLVVLALHGFGIR